MNYDNSKIRRRDRTLDQSKAIELLKNGEYGVLSIVGKNNSGYGIPLSYAYCEGKIYFHCAPEGEKLEALKVNNKVSFCVVGKTEIIPDKFTTAYESILIKGAVTLSLTDQEKADALWLIVDKYSPEHKEIGVKYIKGSFDRTNIIRLDIESVSGKCKSNKT